MNIRPLGNALQSSPASNEKTPGEVSPPLPSVAPVASSVHPDAAIRQVDGVSNSAQVTESLKSINKTMQALSRGLEFSVDEDTDRTVVKVVDQETKEVIRQMPTKEALEIAKALDRVQGLLVRQKA